MFQRISARGSHHTPHELLSAYLDGQVTPRERQQVEQHLRACATCANELETLRYAKDLLQTLPPVSLPRAFTLSEAQVGIATAHRRRAHLVTYLQGATALVAALLLVVVAGDALRLGVPRATLMPAAVEKAVVVTVVVEVQVTPELLAAPMAAQAPAAQAIAAEAEVEPELFAEAMVTGAPAEEAAVAAQAEPRAAAKATEYEMEALSATPFGAPAGMGAGPEETLSVAAAGLRADEETAEALVQGDQFLPEITPAPEAMLKQALAPAATPAAAQAMPCESPAVTEAPLVAEAALREGPVLAESLPAAQALPEEAAVASDQVAATAAAARQPTTPPSFSSAGQRLVGQWWTTRRIAEVSLAIMLVILLALTLWLRRRAAWPHG